MSAVEESRKMSGGRAATEGHRGRMSPLVVVLAVLAVVATASVLTACARVRESGQQSPASSLGESPVMAPTGKANLWTRPAEGTCDCHGDTWFESLRDLTAESDLVVIATVEESRVADVIDKGAEFPTRTIHTSVAVEEVLKGSSASGGVVVSTHELAFGGPGFEDWRQPGHRVLLFLTSSRETPDAYVLSNLAYYQAAYFVAGEEIDITVGGDVTGLSERIAAMTLSELREQVQASQT
jgi:hypothetical protein